MSDNKDKPVHTVMDTMFEITVGVMLGMAGLLALVGGVTLVYFIIYRH